MQTSYCMYWLYCATCICDNVLHAPVYMCIIYVPD